MSRIGELLLEHGWVDQANLRRALSEQSLTGGKRLCSMLIARGLLDPDHAARALGEQYGVAAVLQRHLEHRDPALAELLPATLARSLCALPIGRTRSGDLIVCVRDPNADVEAALSRALDQPLVIAVAPASQLEQLIEQSYEADSGNEFDVDLSTGTQIEPPNKSLLPADEESSMPDLAAFSLVELDDVRVTKEPQAFTVPSRTTPPPFASVTPPFGSTTPPPMSSRSLGSSLPPSNKTPPPSTLPPSNKRPTTSSPFSSITPPFATATPPHPQPVVAPIGSLELDPELDPEIDDVPPPPPPARPPTTPPPLTAALGTQPPRGPSRVVIPPIGEPLPRGPTPTSPLPPARLTIEDATAAIADAISRDTATDVAMRYAAQRWSSSLLLAVKEGAALGHRGHGANLSLDTIRAVAIPLTSPSIVKVAHDTRQLVTEPPPGVGAIHERLLRLLASRKPIAAPIVVAKRIACIIVVGDPIGSGDSAADLDKLATALVDAYTRILRDLK
jgi:hypothetical protein